MKVAVLEGDFAQLSAMGLPLAVAVQLQQSALRLKDALWTAKHSGSGRRKRKKSEGVVSRGLGVRVRNQGMHLQLMHTSMCLMKLAL